MEVVKDKGELLIENIEEALDKFKGRFGRGKKEIKKLIENVNDFKKSQNRKYKELSDKTFEFPGISGDADDITRIEKSTSKEFALQVDKLLILNELIKVEKLNPPQRLRAIADRFFKEGKIPISDSIKTILEINPSKEDYKFIERGLKIGNWLDIEFEIREPGAKRDMVYGAIVSDEKFGTIENSIIELKKTYDKDLRIAFTENNFDILPNEEQIKNILAMKKRVESLVDYYQTENIKDLIELRMLADIKKGFDLEFFLEGEPRKKLDKIRELYGLKGFKSVKHLINWFDIGRENFELISSAEFAKKLEMVSNKIGWAKEEIIHYFAEENFRRLGSPVFEELAKDNIVLSEDANEAKLPLSELFTTPGVLTQAVTLYGRERNSAVRNITDFITLGRKWRNNPYKGWEYVAATRGLKREDIESEVPQDFLEGERVGEPGLREAKKRVDHVKEHLPIILKPRFEKILKTLEEWGNEGKKIEEKVKVPLVAGAYVRFDSGFDAEKSLGKKLDISAGNYKELYINLDKGFKAASGISPRLGKGIEQLYFLMQKKSRDLTYLKSHQSELSKKEKEIIEDKYKYLLEPIELMECVLNSQKGVYFNDPPLHGGARGEDARDWTPQSHALRDRIFYKSEKGGKENYINVKEYHLGQREDDLKVRLYSFSDKSDPKNLGEGGMTLEIERNGKTKFLNEKETEIFMKEIKKRTLAALYLEDSMLLKIER